MYETEKMLVTSIFSLYHDVFCFINDKYPVFFYLQYNLYSETIQGK